MSISYLQWLELQHYQPRSIETLQSTWRHLKGYLSEQNLTINQQNLQRYSEWVLTQFYSKKYEHQLHWGLKQYVYYLEQVHGQVIELHLPWTSARSAIRPALSRKELARVSSWLLRPSADYWFRQTLWGLFYGAGLRRSEALGLRLNDLKLRDRLLQVRTAKSGKMRLLPLSEQQAKSLVQYIQIERPRANAGFESSLLLGRRGGKADSLVGKELGRWQVETGLGVKLTWHALRHSIATQLVASGMEIEQVSQFLGHENVGSTSRYLHADVYNQKSTNHEL